ncbi:hypothetical protein NA57DRAFT_18327, partial [Rhizodiscina lignyota]
PMHRGQLYIKIPSPPEDKEEYVFLKGWNTIQKVLRELEGEDGLMYEVRYGDNHNETLPFEKVLQTTGGESALSKFESGENSISENTKSSDSEDELNMVETRRTRVKAKPTSGFVNTVDAISDDEVPTQPTSRQRRGSPTRLRLTYYNEQEDDDESADEEPGDEESEDDDIHTRRKTRSSLRSNGRSDRRSSRLKEKFVVEDDTEKEGEESDNDSDLMLLESDILPRGRKRKSIGRQSLHQSGRASKASRVATRRSDRTTRTFNNMEEIDIDNIYRSDSTQDGAPVQPKIAAVREVFKLLLNSVFRRRHIENCETCGKPSTSGPLICCQGCTLAYHKACLGTRTTREHLVTKVGEDDFVLQCRRCVNAHHKKDHLAPNLGRCQICSEAGSSCKPFRQRKTPAVEQRERLENGGLDPVTHVRPELINNEENVLFRCVKCWRAFHFHHLPNINQYHVDSETATDAEIADSRYNQYKTDWICKDCKDMPADVGGLVAWRPVDTDATTSAGTQFAFDELDEDDKEYLIKWKERSYAQSVFMPGAWVYGVTAIGTRAAFAKKENGPKMRIEDAIPEEFLRIDIVLSVEYTNKIDANLYEVDKARISEVARAYIKYKGLPYEDAVWEIPPRPEEGDRWVDFVTAYNDWVLGRYVHLPKLAPLKARLEKVRAQEFSNVEKKKQPDNVTGGEMMKYQIDGLNWLYYQWHQQKNGILADEMGLGKTIQVIAFLAMMVNDNNCFPFLVVVPNSTVPNWRREIKKWAPSLRVVTFFGTSAARDIAYKYELFPEGSNGLRAHVVVTSYDAAADDNCRKFFRRVPWQGLIVDEGQRLKNERSILHLALKALKVPYRILLTGTPLQNNAKELFNLLEFLDDTLDADKLEREYEDMTEAKIRKLHELIRPFILRRTKAQVLTFLPPMAQIILPVSMSVLQKKVYMSILAQNPELLKALFSRRTGSELNKNEHANLSNILMQLRKCLCHPFVYSREIEERNFNAAVLHRGLVEASSKLQLLELLLPKLKERGHRVLIFSQFLDMLDIMEDFLDGMQLKFQRLDGQISSLEKQKRIDQFNMPDSDLFAFLLSTRAGGVGINLATADTVIILDPDFNPHQDIQALSRAHRIGQTKKVLCFQLMTRHSAEEKIMHIGRKKMALDHVVVEQLDADDEGEKDLESILRHGAAELFTENNEEQEIKYDNASVDKLLDRSHIENTKTGGDDSAESQFSFARVWANDQGTLEENIEAGEEKAPDPTVWDKILKERERAAAAEAAARQQALGRGKRARMAVDYVNNATAEIADGEITAMVEAEIAPLRNARRKGHEDSDTDFQPDEEKEQEQSADEEMGAVDADELSPTKPASREIGTTAPSSQSRAQPPKQLPGLQSQPKSRATHPTFKRARVQPARVPAALPGNRAASNAGQGIQTTTPPYEPPPPVVTCSACGKTHHQGSCPLKLAGVEFCNLCGLAHFGVARTCPHVNSETQVILMIEALKQSREAPHLKETALKYLKGVKGTLVQAKRKAREKA